MWKKVRGIGAADVLLIGWILCIGLTEAAHLAALFLGRSFSDAVGLFLAAFAALFFLFLGLVLYRGRGRKHKRAFEPYTAFQVGIFLVFALLVLYQLFVILSAGSIYRAGDMTAETVESFLKTDAVYQVNPLTGQAYAQGMPLRVKILCLPTFYGVLARIFRLTAAEAVWGVGPVVTLFGSYLAFYTLAQCFFPGNGGREKRGLFLLFVAAVFCVGDYLYGVDGFGILYSGFRGVTIRNCVLVPYALGAALRRKSWLAALCILAEASIVWTLYGCGACLFVTLGIYAARAVTGRRGPGRVRAGKGA